ncbi:MAG: urea transporter [Propionibacteriaceae bacterium]|nr:urea transporter [Propionibacteriaceae bacterium]
MTDFAEKLPAPIAVVGRGVGQIYLQPNLLTGALILLGIAIASPLMALLALLGTLGQTLAAAALGLPGDDRSQGLDGYNGALVGCAAWVTFDGAFWPALLATILGAAACPTVAAWLAWALKPLKLPVLTAPFCVVAGLTLLVVRTLAPAASYDAATGGGVLDIAAGWLSGVSQVVLVEGALSGLVMLAGLFVAGWRVGAAAAAGSAIGVALALAVGTPPAVVGGGLAGFSPVLTAIALAAVFLKPGGRAWAFALVGAAVTWGVTQLLVLTPIPAYTWPFILTTWAFLLIARRD